MGKTTKSSILGQKWLYIIGAVIAGIIIFTLFFNGKGLYFTFGMSGSSAMKVGSVQVSSVAANVLLADGKTDLVNVSDENTVTQEVQGVSMEDYLKTDVKNKLSRIAALNCMAKDKGIVLSHTESESANAAALKYYQSLSDEQKNAIGADISSLEVFYKQYAIAEKMYNYLVSDAAIDVTTDDARVISIQYICADSYDRINEAQAKLDGGTPFYDVAEEINGNSETAAEVKRGQMEQEFEDVAFALESGEVSDIFECKGRYYIVKCTSYNMQSKTDANKEYLIEKEKNEYFERKFVPYENDHYIEIKDSVFEKMNVSLMPVLTTTFDKIYKEEINI